jgi:hypothetical protein
MCILFATSRPRVLHVNAGPLPSRRSDSIWADREGRISAGRRLTDTRAGPLRYSNVKERDNPGDYLKERRDAVWSGLTVQAKMLEVLVGVSSC